MYSVLRRPIILPWYQDQGLIVNLRLIGLPAEGLGLTSIATWGGGTQYISTGEKFPRLNDICVSLSVLESSTQMTLLDMRSQSDDRLSSSWFKSLNPWPYLRFSDYFEAFHARSLVMVTRGTEQEQTKVHAYHSYLTAKRRSGSIWLNCWSLEVEGVVREASGKSIGFPELG